MIRTNNFVKALSDKGLVDDAMLVENGYDIQYKGNIVSVRLNERGGALIYNHKKNNLFEVQSGRLDEVLHKYIIQSLFGTQSKIGLKGMECKNTFFVPTKVIQSSVIFEDSVGRKFVMEGNSPEAVLSYFNQACNVNADDCMLLLNNFKVYNHERNIKSSVETPDVEVQLLKSSVNPEDYSVSPKAECINDVGQTIVGNFLCSAADKWNYMTFEEDTSKMFSFGSASKRITSSAIRSKNPLTMKAKEALTSNRKAVQSYIDRKFPNGLCVSALENVLAYETPELYKEAGITDNMNYGVIFNNYLKDCDSVQFRMDSAKSILCAVCKENKSVAKFRAVPVLSEMKQPLQHEGYLLSELESGLEFGRKETAIKAIVSNLKDFVPVVENTLNKPNSIAKITGNDCREILQSYGINDAKGVFNTITQVVLY